VEINTLSYTNPSEYDLIGMNLLIYGLSGIIVLLTTTLIIKGFRRKMNTQVNIWAEQNASNNDKWSKMTYSRPRVPPPPHMFHQP